jgi:peptidyl-prolyl cis-trans isomerase B (cyclophilin B)
MISVNFKNIFLVVFCLLALCGCKGLNQTLATEKKMTKNFKEPTQSTVDPNKSYEAIIETDKGNIRVKLFAKEAPLSVTNFIQLAKGGFYEGLTFHRVEPGFVIQGGDPSGDGTGGPGYTVPAEIGKPHLEGALAWARTGDEVNPQRRSSGSQFYITLAPTPFLDSGYTVFGQTIEGMDVVKQIRRGDKIKKIVIVEK